MKLSKIRTLVAMAGAGLASSTLSCAGQSAPMHDTVSMLVERSRESNAALMRGDVDRYRELVTLADDFTLMSPFGGEPSGAPSREGMERMGRFFRDGTHEQELVHAYHSRDMVVLAVIERSRVAVGGLPVQEWALRVTLVYRRRGTEWLLVHRHADPLVEDISLSDAAALARREPRAE